MDWNLAKRKVKSKGLGVHKNLVQSKESRKDPDREGGEKNYWNDSRTEGNKNKNIREKQLSQS